MADVNLIELTEDDDWNFDRCAACGSEEVTDLGLTVNSSLTEVERIAWCGERSCQDDMMQSLGAVLLVHHIDGDRYRLAPPPHTEMTPSASSASPSFEE